MHPTGLARPGASTASASLAPYGGTGHILDADAEALTVFER
jgi:hypothetical protein